MAKNLMVVFEDRLGTLVHIVGALGNSGFG